MATAEEYAKTILDNTTLFFELIDILSRAGKQTMESHDVRMHSNSVCVLPFGIPNLTRRVAPLSVEVASTKSVVQFDPRSITIVGSAALQAYDFIKYRQSDRFKGASDIDAVWWPIIQLPPNFQHQVSESAELVNTSLPQYAYITQMEEPYHYAYSYGGKNVGNARQRVNSKNALKGATNYAVLSSSRAIHAVVREYSRVLTGLFAEFNTKNNGYLEIIARQVFSMKSPKISSRVAFNNLIVAGVCNIWGYLDITEGTTTIKIKLLELTIHDGASSQKSATIEPAQSDIIYSLYNSVVNQYVPYTLRYKQNDIHIPQLNRLMDQQLLALSLRVGDSHQTKQKIASNILRCIRLYNIMKSEMGEIYMPQYKERLSAICTKYPEYARLCAETIGNRALLPTPVAEPSYMPPMATPSYMPAMATPSYMPAMATPSYMPPMATPSYMPPMATPSYMPPMATPSYMPTMAAAPSYMPTMDTPQASRMQTPMKIQWLYKGITPDKQYNVYQLLDEYTGQVYNTKYHMRSVAATGQRAVTRKRKTKSGKNAK